MGGDCIRTAADATARSAVSEVWTAAAFRELVEPITAISLNGDACLRWLDPDALRPDELLASVSAIIRDARRAAETLRSLGIPSAVGELHGTRLDLDAMASSTRAHFEATPERHDARPSFELATDLALGE